MNLHWRRRRPGESFEVWSERVDEVRVTKREPVTGEVYIAGWGWFSAKEEACVSQRQ